MSQKIPSFHSELLQHAKNMNNVVNSLNNLQINEESTHKGLAFATDLAGKVFSAAANQEGKNRIGLVNQGITHLQNVADSIGLLHPNSRHHQSALMVLGAAKEAAAKYLLQ
jgi:hypothetical protein